MAVQTNIAAGYLTAFEGPLGVSIQATMSKWPFLQLLGFAGTITNMNQTFHGVKDFNDQMSAYSGTNPMLTAAWNLIKQLAPTNPEVLLRMFPSPILGMVGTEFQALTGFGEAFAISPNQLKSPAAINLQVASAAVPTSLPIVSTVGVL